MQREILFRGKRVDNGEWVEGNYIEKIKPTEVNPVFWCCFIQDKAISMYEVIPESIGQFTGLTDKNGKKIFEKDIVRIERIGNKRNVISQVQYIGSCFQIKFSWNISKYASTSIVIGNVTDTPELLN